MPARYPKLPLYHPGDEQYPFAKQSLLYHASWRERRVLKTVAFLGSHVSVVKQFANKFEGDIRTGQPVKTPGGYIARFTVERLPTLVEINNFTANALARALAADRLLDLHPMPRRAGGGRGVWLSELAIGFYNARPVGVDGWYFQYGASAIPGKPYAEYMLFKPMQFLRFRGSAHVSALDWSRRKDFLERVKPPWWHERGNLDGLNEASTQSDVVDDIFIEVTEEDQ